MLKEATHLINAKGLGATSLSDLLAASGAAKGSFYHYFPGKEDLGLAVLARARAQFMEFLEGAVSAETPREALGRFFGAVLEVHRGVGFVGGCIFGNTALEMGDADAAYGRVVAEVFAQWIERLRLVVSDAQAAGQVRTDLPAGVLAQYIVSSLEGGIMLSRLKKEEGPLASCVECLEIFLRDATRADSMSIPDRR
ncbi:MAG: TetR/AcrR family transcriptional regulator [Thermoleophilia bacterium]|nr:TetR/AcrR family transcriptional regulator [Thermoleophilia bacterium]